MGAWDVTPDEEDVNGNSRRRLRPYASSPIAKQGRKDHATATDDPP
jgi:hypothetical protein